MEAVVDLKGIHNLCFKQKIRKIMYTLKTSFLYKFGCLNDKDMLARCTITQGEAFQGRLVLQTGQGNTVVRN